jgi:MFS family permease
MSNSLPDGQLRKVLSGLMLAMFLAALDQTIVAVVLPDIARGLPPSELLPWIVSAYLLAMTVAAPIAGKLGDLYGRSRVLYCSIALFVAASLLCAQTSSISELVSARALQGIGAGAMMTSIQSLIGELIAPAERGRYQAWFSGMFAIASLLGPVAGSALGQLSWRWVFWINLPLGLLALLLAMRGLSGIQTRRGASQIDYFGCLLLVLSLGSIMLLITRVGHGLPWQSATHGRLALFGILGLAAFAYWQTRAKDPLLPPQLMRIATLRAGWTLMFFSSFQAVGLGVLIPMQAQGNNATAMLIALAAGVPMGAYTGGRLSAQLKRYKPLIVAGASLLPLSLIGVACSGGSLAMLLAFLMLSGIALGLQFPTVLVAVQNTAPAQQLGVATACCGMVRGLGGALGAALFMSALVVAAAHNQNLGDAFRQLMLLDAGLSLIPLFIALRLEDIRLAERAHYSTEPHTKSQISSTK